MSLRALSIDQPYAILVAYGIKGCEFRRTRLFAEGTQVWIVSSKHMQQWNQLCWELAHAGASLDELGHKVGGRITEHNYMHWFPRQCVLARVRVSAVKPSILSVFHVQNPSPATYKVALELDDVETLDHSSRTFLRYAQPGGFRIHTDVAHKLHSRLSTCAAGRLEDGS